ncbi:MAG: hypothetical protein WAZ77_02755 [Candidatus Nitrosopolaris sp.]
MSIIGHSERTIIAQRVAIDNSTKVKNIIHMGTEPSRYIAQSSSQPTLRVCNTSIG